MDKDYLFLKFCLDGALSCKDVRNLKPALKSLEYQGLVRRVCKGKKVFYELTEKTLPLLDDHRQELWHRVQRLHNLHPHSQQYKALNYDLRFLNEDSEAAKEFRFLGDWQLKSRVGLARLRNAQNRFYERALDE